MKQIILLTDFSKNAQNAINYALHFFKAHKCNFHVMYVHKVRSYISDDLMSSSTNNIHQSIVSEPKQKLETLVDTLKNQFKNNNYSFEVHVDFDVLTDAVNQIIDTHKIDFVVMGTNGVTGAKEVILGSNTINVIRSVNCKTIVVPENYTYNSTHTFLLTLQPDDSLNDDAFGKTMDFIKAFNLKLHILRIYPENKVSETAVFDKQKLAIINCKYTIVENTTVDNAISNYLENNNVDIMGFIASNKNFFERLFKKSYAKQISNNLQKPLLVLHNN